MRWARPTSLFRRVRQIHQTEGLISLLRQGLAFLVGRLFEHRTYYLYAHFAENDREYSELDFMPAVDNLAYRVVYSNQEADELEGQGLEFRSQVVNAREALDRGAIAFCIFVGKELANIGWLAVTQQAKDVLNEPPYKVDFSGNEACATAVWTNPKYRRIGLRAYGSLKRSHFMLEKGLHTSRGATSKGNIASREAATKLGSRVYAEGRLLRVLWWKSWRESPLAPDEAVRRTEAR